MLRARPSPASPRRPAPAGLDRSRGGRPRAFPPPGKTIHSTPIVGRPCRDVRVLGGVLRLYAGPGTRIGHRPKGTDAEARRTRAEAGRRGTTGVGGPWTGLGGGNRGGRAGRRGLSDVVADAGAVLRAAAEYPGGTQAQAVQAIEDKTRRNTELCLRSAADSGRTPRPQGDG
jgi:hypothetical protein